jgi:hypothetical protein
LIAETGAKAVFENRRYEPAAIARDAAVAGSRCQQGIGVETFNARRLV